MLSNKFTQPFFQVITSESAINDIASVVCFWDKVYDARLNFENSISDALIILSDEQQLKMLLQVLESLSDRARIYYVDEYYQTGDYLTERYNSMTSLFQNYIMTYKFAINIPNRSLSQDEVSLASAVCISEEFAYAYENTRLAYLDIAGEEKAMPWILDRREFIAQNSEWKAAERERLGLPPDTRPLVERLEDVFFEDVKAEPIETTIGVTTAPIPWRYGLADFAETLYKLERKGAIDLKSYFESKGSGAGLVRAISSLFAFPNDKSAVTLNNYLSEIRKSLGRGPLDAGVLKAIGRIRGGKMDDVLPDEPEPNTP